MLDTEFVYVQRDSEVGRVQFRHHICLTFYPLQLALKGIQCRLKGVLIKDVVSHSNVLETGPAIKNASKKLSHPVNYSKADYLAYC